jgi:hypothetical protein
MVDRDRLTLALKDARLTEAAQFEAILDLRDAKSLRLEGLRIALLPALSNHPTARKLFDLNVQPGTNPRLWIDLISSVVMEPDPRTYRLLQDHNSQRQVLFETEDADEMTQFLMRYLAHRIIAHERAEAGASLAVLSPAKGYSLGEMIYVWATGLAFGVLGLMVTAMLLGRLHF